MSLIDAAVNILRPLRYLFFFFFYSNRPNLSRTSTGLRARQKLRARQGLVLDRTSCSTGIRARQGLVLGSLPRPKHSGAFQVHFKYILSTDSDGIVFFCCNSRDYAWIMLGLCLEYAWIMLGLRSGYAWNMLGFSSVSFSNEIF